MYTLILTLVPNGNLTSVSEMHSVPGFQSASDAARTGEQWKETVKKATYNVLAIYIVTPSLAKQPLGGPDNC